ncbi:hypothetical protein, partial [Mariniphaga sediminis]|uniref:hypothetical protein n=1 Tax=Mariniphaga sediminis TaxID=1628158 RepID=UPI00356177B2
FLAFSNCLIVAFFIFKFLEFITYLYPMYDDDYIKNYLRKRAGGSFWPSAIIFVIAVIVSLINWIFQLEWF